MNDIISNINSRRSVRQFTDQKISRADLETIVLAGREAPTGKNNQARVLTVVQRPEMIADLCRAMATALDVDPGYDMYRPNAIIIVSEHREESNAIANCACAMQNMMLAAHSIGIGSVWINQLKHVCDDPDVRALLGAMNIPDTHKSWCNLALGYAAVTPDPKTNAAMAIDWFI